MPENTDETTTVCGGCPKKMLLQLLCFGIVVLVLVGACVYVNFPSEAVARANTSASTYHPLKDEFSAPGLHNSPATLSQFFQGMVTDHARTAEIGVAIEGKRQELTKLRSEKKEFEKLLSHSKNEGVKVKMTADLTSINDKISSLQSDVQLLMAEEAKFAATSIPVSVTVENMPDFGAFSSKLDNINRGVHTNDVHLQALDKGLENITSDVYKNTTRIDELNKKKEVKAQNSNKPAPKSISAPATQPSTAKVTGASNKVSEANNKPLIYVLVQTGGQSFKRLPVMEAAEFHPQTVNGISVVLIEGQEYDRPIWSSYTPFTSAHVPFGNVGYEVGGKWHSILLNVPLSKVLVCPDSPTEFLLLESNSTAYHRYTLRPGQKISVRVGRSNLR